MLPYHTMAGTYIPAISSVLGSGGAVGDIAGGYPVTITGTGFVNGVTTFAVGGTPLTNVSITSSTTATATMPAKASGSYDVTATTLPSTGSTVATFEFFSPAQLVLTEWHRGPYAGSSGNSYAWPGTASAGGSGTQTAAPSTALSSYSPTIGTGLNGYASAQFVPGGSNKDMLMGARNRTMFTGASGTFIALAKTTTQYSTATAGAGNLLTELNVSGSLAAGISTSGFICSLYDGTSSKTTPVIALANNTWAACEMIFDGSSLVSRVNGGTQQSIACGGYSPTATTRYVCLSRPPAGGMFAGEVVEWIAVSSALSATNRDKIRSYFNTRYFPNGAQV